LCFEFELEFVVLEKKFVGGGGGGVTENFNQV